ncbi:hypothetical protein M422DRAFT_786245, partial [Sphaerobolus stellatus SS14]
MPTTSNTTQDPPAASTAPTSSSTEKPNTSPEQTHNMPQSVTVLVALTRVKKASLRYKKEYPRTLHRRRAHLLASENANGSSQSGKESPRRTRLIQRTRPLATNGTNSVPITPLTPSPRRTLTQRALTLFQDPRIRSVEEGRVLCVGCDEWVQFNSREKGGKEEEEGKDWRGIYDVEGWERHVEACERVKRIKKHAFPFPSSFTPNRPSPLSTSTLPSFSTRPSTPCTPTSFAPHPGALKSETDAPGPTYTILPGAGGPAAAVNSPLGTEKGMEMGAFAHPAAAASNSKGNPARALPTDAKTRLEAQNEMDMDVDPTPKDTPSALVTIPPMLAPPPLPTPTPFPNPLPLSTSLPRTPIPSSSP